MHLSGTSNAPQRHSATLSANDTMFLSALAHASEDAIVGESELDKPADPSQEE